MTRIVAAWNEERAIGPTVDRIARLAYAAPIGVVLADNNSTDRTADVAQEMAQRHGLGYGRCSNLRRQAPGAQHGS